MVWYICKDTIVCFVISENFAPTAKVAVIRPTGAPAI